ncbi:MAG: DUF429 domain-containing protein [Desulfurococcales archaeon]|nr:DUF429 domain-containing protein [Desulfurococcales archaeon]
MAVVVAGLDLAASSRRCSGYSVIKVKDNRSFLTKVKCLGTDESIINEVVEDKVYVIAIDAPLVKEPKMRVVDKLMIKQGLRVFPPNFSWMRKLSERGWLIAEKLRSLGIEVIETHPRSAMAVSGTRSLEELLDLLGIKVSVSSFSSRILHRDLRDSVVAAVVAYCYIKRCYDVVKASDGSIYILKKFRS